MIKLLVGLGNPGLQHQNDRHNVGFFLVDQLVGRFSGAWRVDKSAQARVAEIVVDGQRLRVVKPQTFMNRSGTSVATIARYYKWQTEEIMVVHDELDLAPGLVKVKFGGGHAGHNGLRDIASHLGSGNHWRLRIGIGHPGHRDAVISWVLGKAPRDQMEAIEEAIDKALAEIATLIGDRIELGVQALHRA